MKRVTEAERMLIGGELVESLGGEWMISVDPATEEPDRAGSHGNKGGCRPSR
jgi:hypothetical protein